MAEAELAGALWARAARLGCSLVLYATLAACTLARLAAAAAAATLPMVEAAEEEAGRRRRCSRAGERLLLLADASRRSIKLL